MGQQQRRRHRRWSSVDGWADRRRPTELATCVGSCPGLCLCCCCFSLTPIRFEPYRGICFVWVCEWTQVFALFLAGRQGDEEPDSLYIVLLRRGGGGQDKSLNSSLLSFYFIGDVLRKWLKLRAEEKEREKEMELWAKKGNNGNLKQPLLQNSWNLDSPTIGH